MLFPKMAVKVFLKEFSGGGGLSLIFFFFLLKFSTPRIKHLFSQALNGRLPLEHGSDRRETLGKRVSDDSRHFIFRHPPIFFGIFFVQKFGVNFFFKNAAFWRSQEFLSVTGRFLVENHCLQFVYFLSTILDRGVKVVQTVFAADLAPKMTFILNHVGCLLLFNVVMIL